MRVVADTDVLVSALIFPGGIPEDVYRLALEGRIELVTSPPLLAELGRLLVEMFGWETGQATEAVDQLVRVADIVSARAPVSEIAADPSDNRVLEAAAEGRVDMIVSGASHLLELGSWRGIQIQPPAALLASFEDS